MIFSFSDFLSDNAVVIILLILGAILGAVYYIKKNVLSKYNDSADEDQTPEEILQDEMDNLVVTEKYNPILKNKKKNDVFDDDDDFDYDNVEEKKEETDSFEMNVSSSYSFSDYNDENKDK